MLIKFFVAGFIELFVTTNIIVFECEYGGHVIIIASSSYSSVDIIDYPLIMNATFIGLIFAIIIFLGLGDKSG